MKRRWIIAAFLCAVLLFTGCSAGRGAAPGQGKSVSDLLQEAGKESVEETGAAPAMEQQARPKSSVTYDRIDEDLSVLSGTVSYAKVYDMLSEPDSYLGKVVKITGYFSVLEDNDRYYFSCIIPDATACCSQGFEFVLAGNYVYPEQYPKEGETITVTGVFQTYVEGQYRFAQLVEATLSD